MAAVTLMSTDVDRLTMSIQSLNEMWAQTAEVALGIWLLERQLRWVCVTPIIIVVGTSLPFPSIEDCH
jgi:ATP-binding cassette subfamily C (CFTR/MRP) protein 1